MSYRVLTGLQANNKLHIGNYLGGILPVINMQKKADNDTKFFMFVPDLHSFTLPIDYTSLYQNVLENVKIYLAAGIDPSTEKTIMYRQSYVPAHSELAWILSCFGYFGELNRMTQFKDKSVKYDNVSVGLFTYPLLMAADILLYEAEYIPVGDDQKQHLELTRDIAIRMNNKFEERYPEGLFVVPKPWQEQLRFMHADEGVRIRSLTEPTKKMSKSDFDEKGTIYLTDNPQYAAKKIMSSTTDSYGSVKWDWDNQPGITNLIQISYLLGNQSKEQVLDQWEGQTKYGDFKKYVSGIVETFLTDFQSRLDMYSQDQIEKILIGGETRANQIAMRVLNKTQNAVGLRASN